MTDDLEFIVIIVNITSREWGLKINLNKTGYIAFSTDQRFPINPEENVTNKQVQNF